MGSPNKRRHLSVAVWETWDFLAYVTPVRTFPKRKQSRYLFAFIIGDIKYYKMKLLFNWCYFVYVVKNGGIKIMLGMYQNIQFIRNCSCLKLICDLLIKIVHRDNVIIMILGITSIRFKSRQNLFAKRNS